MSQFSQISNLLSYLHGVFIAHWLEDLVGCFMIGLVYVIVYQCCVFVYNFARKEK